MSDKTKAPEAGQASGGAFDKVQSDYNTTPHPYLELKGIDLADLQAACKCKVEIRPTTLGNFRGLAVFRELLAVDGSAKGFERILPERITFNAGDKPNDKFTQKGSAVSGTFTPIGFHPSELMSMDCCIIVCAGLADGYRLHEATGEPVACGVGEGNVRSIAEAIRPLNPRILVAVDNDQAGKKAGAASGFEWAHPINEKDWSDVYQTHGLPAVKDQLFVYIKKAGQEAPQQPKSNLWPEPADLFAEHVVPSFPMEILPEQFRTLAAEKSEQSGFDAGAYGFCLFMTAANTVDHRAKLDLGPFKVPAYQWGGLVGDSGTAKSPILNDSKQGAEHIDKALLDESKAALSKWISACQNAKGDKQDPPPKPAWKQRHALDTTTEALGLLLQDNPEGVNMYHHEITEFIGRMDAYSGKDGGKDRGVYLRSYDGGYVTINRASGKPQPIVIDNFSVGILAGIQPEKLAYLFKKSGGGSDGLYQRFLMYCLQPAGDVNYMAKESPFTQMNNNLLIERIHNWTGKEQVSARLSTPAKLMMQDYHNNIRKLATRTAAQRFAEHINKFPGMLGRAAFALHCIHAAANERSPGGDVSKETMTMAIKFMRVMYRHSESVYRILDEQAGDVQGLVVAAAEAILSKSWKTFKRGDLTRSATYWQGSDNRQTENAIDYLIELGWIMDITPPPIAGKRGRRSDGVYASNPKVFEQFKAHSERIKSQRAERYHAIKEAAS